MRNKKWLRALSGTVCLVMCCSLFTACDSKVGKKAAEPMELMEVEEVDTYSFDSIGGTDVMPLGGYFGPHSYAFSANGQSLPDYYSDEFMQMVVDCGVNLITSNGAEYSTYPNKTFELLDQAEKFGIGIFVNDGLVNGSLAEDTLPLEQLDDRLSAYINHPACIGAYVVDEPTTDYYISDEISRRLADYAPLIQNLDELGVSAYMNMYPLTSIGTKEVYRQYLRDKLENCPTPFLSYDRYLFNEGNDLTYANIHFVNMALVREAAEEYDVPFWCFVQAGAQWNDAQIHFDSNGYWPTEGAFKWQANTSLAFGAKGLQYFPLLQPYWFAYAESTDFDFARNGLISAWATKNRWWYYAQNVNKQIAAVDEVLMNSVNKGIIISDDSMLADFDGVDYVMKGTAWRELEDVSGTTMVGCFNYFGKSAFYVVNYDIEHAQKITLDFSDNYAMKVVQEAEESYVATDSLTLTMKAGEGVLIVME